MINKTLIRKSIAGGLTALAAVGLFACGGANKPASNGPEPADAAGAETWSVYWYLCGSDLESKLGFASNDMAEMMSVKLPSNVQVVIETGGAYEWANEDVSAEALGRYVYDNSGIRKVDEIPDANMGDAETLKEFLSFCLEEYPADHQAFIFWDHGGGVLGGVSYDEKYFMESLSLSAINRVFDEVCSSDEPVFDLVGFDACLMSTVDTARAISDEARYMVASQELEPGNGWNYKGIYTAFAENPKIEAAELGVIICDSFMEGCEEFGTEMESTLALIDLSKTEGLFKAFEKLGDGLLIKSVEDDSLFAAFSRAAEEAEHYGGNSEDEGYTDMVDLGCIAKNIDFLDNEYGEAAKEIEEALEECVLYKVQGEYRKFGSGLSIYYPLDHSMRSVMNFESNSTFEPYNNFYHFQVFGALTDNAKSYIATKAVIPSGGAAGSSGAGNTEGSGAGLIGSEAAGQEAQESKVFGPFIMNLKSNIESNGEDMLSADISMDELYEFATIDKFGFSGAPIEWGEDNEFLLNIGEDAKYLTCVREFLGYTKDINNIDVVAVGGMPIDYSDFNSGIFKNKVKNEWWYMNGHLVYTLPAENNQNYTLYSVPLIVNGEEMFLKFSHNKKDDSIKILGARKPVNENYMVNKEIIFLKEGDEIQTIMGQSVQENSPESRKLREYENFTLDGEVEFTRGPLPDGIYVSLFVLQDVWGNYAYSATKGYDIRDGEIIRWEDIPHNNESGNDEDEAAPESGSQNNQQ